MQGGHLLLAGSIALGAIAGYGIGHSQKNAAPPPADHAAEVQTEPHETASLEEASQSTTTEPELAKLSGAEFLQWLSGVTSAGYESPNFWEIFQTRLDRVPPEQIPGILSQLLKTEKPGRSADLMSEIVGIWAWKNPAAARAWVLQLPPCDQKDLAMLSLIQTIAKRDPRQAFSMAETLPAQAQEWAIGSIFSDWGKTDPAAASAQVAGLPTSALREKAAKGLAFAWAAKDPQAALTWASQLPANLTRQFICSELLRLYAQQKPGAAFEYLERMPQGVDRVECIKRAGANLIKNDAVRAMQLLDSLPPGTNQDSLLASVTHEWMNCDPQQALAWAKMQTDEHVQAVVLPAAASCLAATNPLAAAQLALSLPESAKKARAEALADVVSVWADKDPVAANAFLQRLPETKSTQAAITQLAEIWMRNLPKAASSWVNTLPEGRQRDAALGGFVQSTMRDDPASAGQWAMGIRDSQTRNSALVHLFNYWRDKDPEAAAQWIARPAFPADLRQLLQN